MKPAFTLGRRHGRLVMIDEKGYAAMYVDSAEVDQELVMMLAEPDRALLLSR